MKKNIFDVLVVYSEKAARSASSLFDNDKTPFSTASKRNQYNLAYAYFLQVCAKNGLKTAFTTTRDIIGAGKCKSYWEYKNNSWVKVKKEGYSSLIFDKFSPVNKKYFEISASLFSSDLIKPFNNNYLHKLFDDKQATFDTLHSFSIPTVALDSYNYKTITRSIEAIKLLCLSHLQKDDFSKELILKDRFGAGGTNIYKINKNFLEEILAVQEKNKKISFILQPFVKFEKGYEYKKISSATDIRLIYQKGRIIQAYIRTAKKNDFRCNEHQGGIVKYVPIKNVPPAVIECSEKIVSLLNKKNALFALDFIISNNGNIYFLEGNINPGIYWGANSPEDELNTKKLIHFIVKELLRRSQKTSSPSFPNPNLPPINEYLSPVTHSTYEVKSLY